jgi:hypothetical protein
MRVHSQIEPTCHFDARTIERIRILATFLLVCFHVIGLPKSGLQLRYANSLRIFADVVTDFRMPAFAMISGSVYALQPVHLRDFGIFGW